MLRIVVLFLAACWTTSAQAESCKTILDAARRLECYDDAFKVDHLLADVLNSPQAVVAILAAVFAFISGVGGPLVTLWIGRKQAAASQTSANAAMLTAKTAGFREIAKLRISWMDNLRDTLAEYHAILMNLEDKDVLEAVSDVDERKSRQKSNDEGLKKIVLLGTQLDLLLNKEDAIQRKLWDITDEIYNRERSTERQALDAPLMDAGRAVLKGEWEKVKQEMRSAEFQPGK
ncbi:hypothetical protein EI171_26050 [Bradyrhizobium sp. LCT2]|uniref:hypothetical protein n=1 Tax=Bradyrhizobium sp. LCT2 TaxID=2493093 RepID=UPI001373B5BA|nr:hypothetical protein [Bradyrhizobium sp. LCT2]QHP70447.1 hypothetical protein EI171_26050 [Bradyrhizobium sp. LCT2]